MTDIDLEWAPIKPIDKTPQMVAAIREALSQTVILRAADVQAIAAWNGKALDLQNLRQCNEILAVRYQQRWGYPAFQFIPGSAQVREPIRRLLASVGPSDGVDHWIIVSWLVFPHEHFNHQRTMYLLDSDFEEILRSMRISFGLDDF